MQMADRLVEGEAAGDADAPAVGGDLLEVGGGGAAELLLPVAPAAGGHHDRVAEAELLHQPRFELLAAGEIELDPNEPFVHRALEQPRDRRGRDAERAGEVLLAPALAVVELEAGHRLPQLARREGCRVHCVTRKLISPT